MQNNSNMDKSLTKKSTPKPILKKNLYLNFEEMQTYEKIHRQKCLLENFYKKNLFPKEIFSELNYSLQIGLDLLEFYNQKTLVCGTINSGKTSFLNAILEENILDFSSFENSKWPIIIRNVKGNDKDENHKQNFFPRLFSAKIINSKYLFEFDKNILLAKGKKNVKNYLKNLNNNEILIDLFKEYQMNHYEKTLKQNIADNSMFYNFKDCSALNSNNFSFENSSSLNEMSLISDNNQKVPRRRRNIVEKSLDEINKTMEKLDDFEIVGVNGAIGKSKKNKFEEYHLLCMKYHQEKDEKCETKGKEKEIKTEKEGKQDKKIAIEFERLNEDYNLNKVAKNYKELTNNFMENILLKNESFIKFLKENDLFNGLFNKEKEINKEKFFKNFEKYNKIKSGEKKNEKIIQKKNKNFNFSPLIFDENIEKFVFILEVDFNDASRIPYFFQNNQNKSEIWDIPGLNSERNQISDIIINNIIKNEKNINENFNFLMDKRLVFVYLSECNNFNQTQNKNIWDKLSFLREFSRENYFILNKIDSFSIEDFKKNNYNFFKNSPKSTKKSTQAENFGNFVKINSDNPTNPYLSNNSISDNEIDTEKDDILIYEHLKNYVKREFYLSSNNNFYFYDKNNTLNIDKKRNMPGGTYINNSNYINTNSSFCALNTTGNLENLHYQNYFFFSENTSVYLISSLYTFLENCENKDNLSEDYWEIKKKIFESNAILSKEYKNFKNFRNHFEEKFLSIKHEDGQKYGYLNTFLELLTEIKYMKNNINISTKLTSRCNEFVNYVIFEGINNNQTDNKPPHMSFFGNFNHYNDKNFKKNQLYLKRYNSETSLNIVSNPNIKDIYDSNKQSAHSNSPKGNEFDECDSLKGIKHNNINNSESLFRCRAYSTELNNISVSPFHLNNQNFKNFNINFNYNLNELINTNNFNYQISNFELILNFLQKTFKFYCRNLSNFIRDLSGIYKKKIYAAFEEFKKEIDIFIDDILIFRESKIIKVTEKYKNFINELTGIKNEFKQKLENFKFEFKENLINDLDSDNKMKHILKNKLKVKKSIIDYFINKILFEEFDEKIMKIENQFNFKISKIIFDISLGISTGLVNGILAFCGTNLIQTILNSKLIFFSSAAFCFTIGIGCLMFFSFREIKNINSNNKQTFMEQNSKMMKFIDRYVEESVIYLNIVLKKLNRNLKISQMKIDGFIDFLKQALN